LIGDQETPALEDLKDFDRPLYNSLKYISENSINDNTLIEQYFVHENDKGEVHELSINGKSMLVTDNNKMLYVIVKTEYLTKDIVSDQLNAMKMGFNSLISHSWVSDFSDADLENVVCGS